MRRFEDRPEELAKWTDDELESEIKARDHDIFVNECYSCGDLRDFMAISCEISRRDKVA